MTDVGELGFRVRAHFNLGSVLVGVPNLQVLSLRHMEYVNRFVTVRLGLWKGSREMDCRD